MNLNAQAGYMNMLSVPGKKAEAVHKDWREVSVACLVATPHCVLILQDAEVKTPGAPG